MMRHFYLSLFVLFFIVSNLFATEIYYPGTFDPFHNTHLREILTAHELHPKAAILILPIGSAYYDRLNDGTRRPQFVPHDQKIEAITRVLSTLTFAEVRDELRDISNPVFDTLIAMARRSKDKDKYLLVGTDILAIWKNIEGFAELTTHFNFLVSRDIHKLTSDLDLEAQFRTHSGFTFFNADTKGIRSTKVLLALFEKSEQLADLVPPIIADDLLNLLSKDNLSRFFNECMGYATQLAHELAMQFDPNGIEMERLTQGIRAYIRGETTVSLDLLALLETPLPGAARLKRILEIYERWYKTGAFI